MKNLPTIIAKRFVEMNDSYELWIMSNDTIIVHNLDTNEEIGSFNSIETAFKNMN